jgi:predicted RNase H-like HicB family nuclease
MEHTLRTFPVIIEKDEDGFFVAINPSLRGCYSQGKTLDEALVNIKEATTLCLETLSPEETSTPDVTSVSVHLIAA